MSVEATRWAWPQRGLSAPAKLVLLAFADHADEEGKSWPSRRTLADECALGTRTVTRAIEQLVEMGLIVREERNRANGSRTSDTTWLNLGATAAIPPLATAAIPEPTKNYDQTSDEIAPNGATSSRRAAHFEAIKISHRLANQMRERDPLAKVAPDSKAWLNEARLLMERDHRPPEQIHEILDWLPTNDFWPGNIQSTRSLRKQFTMLVAHKERPARRHRESASDILRAMDAAAEQRHEADERQRVNQQLFGGPA